MITKDELIEQIRAVPIAGKTYEEYVDAVAESLAGYRKASEVAREIFEEIEQVINYALCVDITEWEAFAELKKKYTEGGE